MQTGYTSLFGMIANFLFLRTGQWTVDQGLVQDYYQFPPSAPTITYAFRVARQTTVLLRRVLIYDDTRPVHPFPVPALHLTPSPYH